MANAKITDLTAYNTPLSGDLFAIVDIATSTTKKITWADLFKSPTLITPNIGAATATSVNNLIITQPASIATLTVANGGALITVGAFDLTLTASANTNVTLPTSGTLATIAGAENFTNKTLSSPSIASPTFTTAFSVGANTVSFTETDNGNSGTADTIDWRTSNKQKSTLTGNVTYTFTAPASPCNLVLRIVQGASSYTVTWPASVKWSGGTPPTITTTNGRVDIVMFYYDGTTYFGSYIQNYTP